MYIMYVGLHTPGDANLHPWGHQKGGLANLRIIILLDVPCTNMHYSLGQWSATYL